MSCLDGKEHEFEYSLFHKCYVCKICKSQKKLIEDPNKFEEIAKSIIQYCGEMVHVCDIGDAVDPIIKWVMNLVYLWKGKDNLNLFLYILNGYIEKDDYGYINLAFSLSKSKIEKEKENWIQNLNHVIQCDNIKCKKDSPDLREKDYDQVICAKCKDPNKVLVEFDQYERFEIEKIEITRKND